MPTFIEPWDSSNKPVFKGIKDGEKFFIECSACCAPLMEIWVTQPNVPIVNFLKVNCAHCGDSSFEVQIYGKFHFGPGSKIVDGIDVTFTDVENIEIVQNTHDIADDDKQHYQQISYNVSTRKVRDYE